jgi:hypothetical protein
MRRWSGILLIAVGVAFPGCGGKASGGGKHGAAEQPAGPAAPTPDTTPIDALRTPAGLVLKPGETPAPAPVTPSPATSPASQAAKP